MCLHVSIKNNSQVIVHGFGSLSFPLVLAALLFPLSMLVLLVCVKCLCECGISNQWSAALCFFTKMTV